MFYPPVFAEGCEMYTCILLAVIRSDLIWSTKHSTHLLDDVSEGDRRDYSRQFSHEWEFREVVRQDEVVLPFVLENVSHQYHPCFCWHFTCDHRFLAVCDLEFLAYSASFCHFVDVVLDSCQYTDSCANIRVLSTLWCPLCNWLRMVPRILSGIITYFPLNRTPSSIPSSSLNDQNERRSVGRSVILSGHLWYTTSANALRIGHRRVSSRNSCCLVGLKFTRSSDISSTLKSSCTSDLSDGLGRRDNTSDMIISLPGRFLTLQS